MLGELQVVDGDVDVPIRGAKQRMLLLLLLVRARETVQAERLADELWGDDQPAGGANALQALVSKLRRALGPLSGALTTGAGGYRIDVADDEIDARCFEAAAAQGREALAAGDAAAAADALSPGPGAVARAGARRIRRRGHPPARGDSARGAQVGCARGSDRR